jgi:hypothetical protein
LTYLTFFAVVTLLAGGAVASAEPQRLSGPQILERIVGNTATWHAGGGRYVEYYRPDGVALGEDNGSPYAALWWVDGDRMCFDYPKSGCVCWRVLLEDQIVYWVSDYTLETSLLRGNPYGFASTGERPKPACSATTASTAP